MEKRKSLLRDVDLFFDVGLGIGKYRYEAAIYYITYVLSRPMALTKLGEEVRESVDKIMSNKRLENGREALIKEGLLAEVLSAYEGEKEFGGEAFLPADPEVLWEEKRGEMERKLDLERVRSVEKGIQQLVEGYRHNFGKYGVVLEGGKLSLLYSATWIVGLLLQLSRRNTEDTLLWLSSGYRSFEEPLLSLHKRILEKGMKLKLMLATKKNIERMKELKRRYGDQIDIRILPPGEAYATARRAICGNELALDARKILPPSSPEPSYVGTIYLEKESIDILRKSFQQDWYYSAKGIEEFDNDILR